MMYRVMRVSSSRTVYRDCVTYHEAIAAIDRLQQAFRYTGVCRKSSDVLVVGLTHWTIANRFYVERY